MKTIAIYCVNYHSYDRLNDYLLSIDTAAGQTGTNVKLSVFVADNTVPATTVDFRPQHFSLSVVAVGENKGYFGAVRFLMDTMSPLDYDYVIISNVDVLLADSFFVELTNLQIEESVGWIAPAILSQTLHFDFNPQAIQRYSLKKMKLLRLMFKYPRLLRLKQKILHQYRDVKPVSSGTIYAGHGSFIILTQAYFKKQKTISYPLFLYGEEIYLAETCRQHALEVRYVPKLEVQDIGKVSTGKFSSKIYCQYNYNAIDYLIKTFYEKTSK